MQNGAENGFSEQPAPTNLQNIPPSNSTNELLKSTINGNHASPQHQANETSESQDGLDSQSAKRRKTAGFDSGKTQRGSSPPWKTVAVEGPSTFTEGGVRKSARTNYVPVGLQPPSDKRKTRGAFQHGRPPAIKSKYGGASANADSIANTARSPKANGLNGYHGAPQAAKLNQHVHSKPPKGPRRPMKRVAAPGDEATPSAGHKAVHRKLSGVLNHSPPTHIDGQPLKRKVGRPRRSSPSKNLSNQHDDSRDSSYQHGITNKLQERSPQKVRLSLRYTMPNIGIFSIGNVVLKQQTTDAQGTRPTFATFEDWLNKEALLNVEEKDKKIKKVNLRMNQNAVYQEARTRVALARAAESGGLLSREHCSHWNDDDIGSPPRLYTHQDRLLAHMKRFHYLMIQEKKRHIRAAKECAFDAAGLVRAKQERAYNDWKKEQPRTAEELAQEQEKQYKEIYSQLREDIKGKWVMVTDVVDDLRMRRWQTEQDRLGKEALNEAIEKSRGLLSKGRRRRSSDEGSEHSDSASSKEPEASSSETDGDESNMSASDTASDEEPTNIDDDDGLTQEQLRRKYQLSSTNFQNSIADGHEGDDLRYNIDEAPTHDEGSSSESHSEANRFHSSVDGPAILEDVDEIMLDESSHSTDMDDESSDDTDQFSADASDGTESDDSDGHGGLGGFLSRVEREALTKQSVGPDAKSRELSLELEDSDDEADKVSLIPDIVQGPTPSATTSEEPQTRVSIDARQTSQLDIAGIDNVASSASQPNQDLTKAQISPAETNEKAVPVQQLQASELPATPISTHTIKTTIPSLLRGTLREYQHDGLHWLAELYAAGTNGILADEMGLGKTIQTIALLAHVAEQHEAWGPHLIVVPTSVMLNWEMEFKKFLPGFKVLTYYGTQEERKKKRAGWMDNDKWNVWITSYTLITQDQQIFKRKAWHYMILDEAHNIKNFQSLRWQTLLTFRTRARLLLTGTPLQNNLTELWSLLYFLMPSDDSGTGIAGFTNLEDFTGWFKRPTEQILEQGREALDDEARVAVSKLHNILRPYLLRRLKADVEQQMPGKYEHVVYCRLSKRQRYLYDGFMSRAQTRETLASGNTFSIMNALMQLRKVCNHPDLFETRQIVTSFAMPRSAVADFEIKELLVRRRLLHEEPSSRVDLNLVNLLPGVNESFSALDTIQKQRLGALGTARQMTSQQGSRVNWNFNFDGSSVQSTLAHYENNARRLRYDRLHQTSYLTSLRSQRRPLYNYDKMEKLRFGIRALPHQPSPSQRSQLSEWLTQKSPVLNDMVLPLQERSTRMNSTIQKFACITPAVVATDMVNKSLSPMGVQFVRDAQMTCSDDAFHEARVRLSIAFPDKRLLQYDCGKLQKLDGLLRRLQTGGHRALIFTQMTRVLDILEQFMNIHGHRYLRLDGATKLEQRQMLTERFNNDNRILAFILSSRSGGIGINLTGADTVIFYDLDWNPAMDKQCQDRCHRIGQTRDVHIYRLVSEHTIEANILKKANQKRMLDDVIIQEGDFTTDYLNNMSIKDIVGDIDLGDEDDAANAAIDRILGKREQGRVLEAVEDQDDAKAAQVAEKELARYDAEDFEEKTAGGSTNVSTPKTHEPADEITQPMPSQTNQGDGVEVTTTMEAVDSGLAIPERSPTQKELPSCDEYMIRFMDWELKDVPVQPPPDKKKKKKGKESLVRKR